MKLRIAFSLAATVLFIAAPQAHTQGHLSDPYQVLERHFEAIGGLDKLKAEKTSRSEGTIVLVGTGLSGTVKAWAEAPDRQRQELDLAVLKQTSGDNGQTSWTVDINGKVQIVKDKAALKRRELGRLMALYEYADPSSTNFTLTFTGIEKVGEVDCYVIEIENAINDDILRQFINRTSFYLQKSVAIRPDDEEHTVYSDYREIGGIMRAFRQDIEALPVGQKATVEMTSYEVGIEIDPALFEPPEKDAADFRFVVGGSAVSVPFQFIENHIFMQVNVSGKERLWLLDSGADISVVDSAYAEELGLKQEGSLTGVGAGNKVQISFVMLPPFSVGGIQFNEQSVGSAGFVSSLVRRHMGMDAVGILGYDFLSRFVTRIDYAGETLTFYNADSFVYDGNGVVLDASIKGKCHSVPMAVEGKYNGVWSLDLGAGGCSFHYPFADENSLLKMDGIRRLGFGAGGSSENLVLQFQNLEFAGFEIKNPRVSAPLSKGVGAFSRKELIGNLGSSLFRHFVLYLDYERQQVIVEKGADFDRQFPEDRSGLQLVQSETGESEVVFVAPHTPADKAGFRIGDVIASVNAINSEYLAGLIGLRKMLREEAGIRYTFRVLREGREKELKLELKDLL
ncbi:MAG: aspartyl protease family protein [candidate division Zixibacteria bacterium]|nr:aspartyl protease family protein [candidate division Zixibacteria bacterium]